MEDPGSDPNRRRQLRHEYRDLITQLNQPEGEDAESLNKTLATADKLYEEVLKTKSAREAALDAVLLRTASTLTYQNAQKLIVDNKFEPKVFSEKLVTILMKRRNEPNSRTQREIAIKREAWSRFGKDVSSCFRRAPPFHFMLGSFDRGPPVQKVKVTGNTKKPEGPTVVPIQISETHKSQQEVTSEEVERMLGILHQLASDGDPVSFFDFVVNPQSFSHTIENIFHMSFLVKDGHVKIELDDDGLPVISPSKPFDPQEHREEVPRKQLILSMDMEDWKEIVEAFEISEPLIPPREGSPKKR